MAGEIIVRYESMEQAIARLNELEARAQSHCHRAYTAPSCKGGVAIKLLAVGEEVTAFAGELARAINTSATKLSEASLEMRTTDEKCATNIEHVGTATAASTTGP